LTALLSGLFSGALCGAIGYHVERINATSLSFAVAHAALAGASIGMVLGVDITVSAMFFSISSAAVLGLLFSRIHWKDLLSMVFFSFFSALALLSVYLSTTNVLATSSVSAVLWGSILAVDTFKLIMLIVSFTAFIAYLFTFRLQIDSILFDRNLAEAEGVDVYFHTAILLLFAGTAIALTLRITGGFLVFALLYNPVASAIQLSSNAKIQLALSASLGAFSALAGVAVSYVLDLPVGAAIAIVSSTVLILTLLKCVLLAH